MSRYLYKKIQNISPESLNFQHSGLKLTTLGYDPTISVTHGITPGGGDGYYISSKGYGTANIERAAYLYLGENARKRRQADRERAKAKSKLRRL